MRQACGNRGVGQREIQLGACPLVRAAFIETARSALGGLIVGEHGRRRTDQPRELTVILFTPNRAIVADEIRLARLAALLARQHGRDGVIDVDQVQPRLPLPRQRLACAQAFDPREQSARTVEARESQDVGAWSLSCGLIHGWKELAHQGFGGEAALTAGLHGFNIASRDDVRELAQRVDFLTRRVQELADRLPVRSRTAGPSPASRSRDDADIPPS